ncbi:MAG: hypothetical protein ACTSR8_19005 [Promethearchaeota archaeon]
MANQELTKVLKHYTEKIKGQVFNIKKEIETFLDIAQLKEQKFKELKELIVQKYNEFKEKNNKRVIKKTFTTFLYNDYNSFFETFIHNFFGLDKDSLKIKLKEKISDSILIIQYKYRLKDEELKLFDSTTKKIEGRFYGKLFSTGFFFFIISVLGIILRRTIKEDIIISMDCANIKEEDDQNTLDFLVLIRKNRKDIFEKYLDMNLFYFLKQIKGIPDDFFDKLLKSREVLFQIAIKEYYTIREKLIDILYYFYKKCKLIGNLCPILDLLNYVCSRVEDSVFSKVDVIQKDFLSNFDYSIEKKNAILKIFDFLDRKSTLYSTFQANNLPSLKSQFNLFLLYIKYFVTSGLEALEVGDLLFLPKIFKDVLNEHNLNDDNYSIGSISIRNIAQFINYLAIISNMESVDLLFKKIFKRNISHLNYKFFRTFLNSFNTKISFLIEEQNTFLSENPENKLFTFNIVVDHICRIIYTLIDKIFLRKTPDDASKNFIDPRGRYIGRNIALRVLELLIFQEINFSDDIWPEYLISLKKNHVKKSLEKVIDIPDKYFYNGQDIIRFMTLYNAQSFTNEITFEEWLIKDIFTPLNEFIMDIKNSVHDLNNTIEVYEILSEKLLYDIEDDKTKKAFKFICQQLAPFWQTIE